MMRTRISHLPSRAAELGLQLLKLSAVVVVDSIIDDPRKEDKDVTSCQEHLPSISLQRASPWIRKNRSDHFNHSTMLFKKSFQQHGLCCLCYMDNSQSVSKGPVLFHKIKYL